MDHNTPTTQAGGATEAQAGGATQVISDAAHKVGETVTAGVEKVKEWYYGTNEDDFKAQMKDVNDIIDKAGNQMERLKKGGDERVSSGLGRIQEYKRQMQNWNRRVASEANEKTKPEELEKFKNEWKCEMKKMYENGLVDVKSALDKLKPE